MGLVGSGRQVQHLVNLGSQARMGRAGCMDSEGEAPGASASRDGKVSQVRMARLDDPGKVAAEGVAHEAV